MYDTISVTVFISGKVCLFVETFGSVGSKAAATMNANEPAAFSTEHWPIITCCSADIELGICSSRSICYLLVQNERIKVGGSHPPDSCTASGVFGYTGMVNLSAEPGEFVIYICYFHHQGHRGAFVSPVGGYDGQVVCVIRLSV